MTRSTPVAVPLDELLAIAALARAARTATEDWLSVDAEYAIERDRWHDERRVRETYASPPATPPIGRRREGRT